MSDSGMNVASNFGQQAMPQAPNVPAEDVDGIRSEILDQLTPPEQQTLRLFIRGVGEKDEINPIMATLGVADEVALLHTCYGAINPQKVRDFSARHKLDDLQQKLLREILQGRAVSTLNGAWSSSNPEKILREILKKTGESSLSGLVASIYMQGELQPRDLLAAGEQEIYDWRIQGLNAEEIGLKVKLKKNTVASSLAHINRVLGVSGVEGLCYEHYGPIDRKQLEFLGSREFKEKNGQKLTRREIDFVYYAMQGLNVPTIARLIKLSKPTAGRDHISTYTAADYHKSVFGKLNLSKPGNFGHGKGAPLLFAKVHALVKEWAHGKPEQDIANVHTAEVDNAAHPAP